MRHTQRGISLFGLAIALAITAIVAAAATPAYQRTTRQWAVSRSAQDLLAALHQARSSATARALPVALCQTDAPGHCGATAGTMQGWQLFGENTITSPPRLDAGDELLQVRTLPPTVELQATRSAVTYWPTARAGTTATFVFCDRRNLAPPRAVIVSQTGRPRLSTRLADGSVPDCSHG
jgi:type IV fimbrial biogenesis protein FimT